MDKRPKILLIEDDEDDYILLKAVLDEIEGNRFDLDWVDNSEMGLALIQQGQHDVYLIDYRLGRSTGLELLQAAIASGCTAPIILLTGQGDRGLDLAAMQAGAADYLVKGTLEPQLLERSIRYSLERTKTLAALRDSESRLESIMASLKDVVWSMSATTQEMLYVSPAIHELFGYSASHFYQNPHAWFEFVHPDDQPRVQNFDQLVLEMGSYAEEYRIIHANGEIRTVYDQARLVCDGQGNPLRLDGITKDITETKQASLALSQAMRENIQLACAIANLELGVVIADATQTDEPIVFANPGFTQITGYAVEEVIGQNCRLLQGPDSDRTVIRSIRTNLNARRSGKYILQNYRKDGTWFWNELTINPVFDPEGKLVSFVGLINDITQRQQTEEAVLRLQHQNELILNAAPEGIYGLDLNGHATFVNPAAARMLGWEVGELIGQPIHPLCHHTKTDGRPYPWSESPIFVAITQGTVQHREDEIFWRRDGHSFPVEYISTPIWEQEQVVGVVVTFQDITERKRSQAALQESQERYELAVSGAKDGLWDWNLKTQEIYFSPRWKAMLGYLDHELINTLDSWQSRVHPEDLVQLQAELNLHLQGLTTHFENEHRVQHRDGSYRWMLSRALAVRDAEGKATRMAGSQTDITARKQVEEQLLHDAFHDALTGLPNRALFMDRLRLAIERAKRSASYHFAVICLDVDRFKVINDSLGHRPGDDFLVEMAHRLQNCLRTGDTVARLGGDEFTILLEGIEDLQDATRMAECIHQSLQAPFNLKGQEVFSSVSMGIALSFTGYDSAETLLRDADTAMYRAKSLGRSRHEIFDQTMHLRAVTLLQLENDLRRAIEREEFYIHYQPIFVLGRSSYELAGFEALVRWQHPERGLVPPSQFITIAEENGLIVPIGLWVLRQACQQMHYWQTQVAPHLPLSLSVNLSSRQFSQPDLLEQIRMIIQETALSPHSLKLEITETVVMENAELAKDILSQLKDLGVQLHIDDFGTGYSSLSYLHHFPIDQLKIDRSFVSRLGQDDDSAEIVRAIVTLSHNLGMTVTAEGIENAKQLEYLQDLGCEYGQGYFFARPLTPVAATELIESSLDKIA